MLVNMARLTGDLDAPPRQMYEGLAGHLGSITHEQLVIFFENVISLSKVISYICNISAWLSITMNYIQ